VEVLGSRIAYSSSVEDLADSLGLERGSLAAFACVQPLRLPYTLPSGRTPAVFTREVLRMSASTELSTLLSPIAPLYEALLFGDSRPNPSA
jgi:hypothetical protein